MDGIIKRYAIFNHNTLISIAFKLKANSKLMFRSSLLTSLILCFSLVAFGQEDDPSQRLPSIDQLPKMGETKTFYEFDAVYDYELLDSTGKVLQKGKTQFVDVTGLPDGDYTFRFNNQTVVYHVGAISKTLPPSKKLPPFDMLPKDGETKTIFEFEREGVYTLYDANGKLLAEGAAEFVDMTNYPNGVYFFNFDGEHISFQKK